MHAISGAGKNIVTKAHVGCTWEAHDASMVHVHISNAAKIYLGALRRDVSYGPNGAMNTSQYGVGNDVDRADAVVL